MTTSGFVGTPPPPDGLWADTQVEAWDLYPVHAATHGYPIRLGGRWFLPRAIRLVNERQAIQAGNHFMVMNQPRRPADWKKVKGALLAGQAQACAWYLAHRSECAGPPQPYDGEFWLVPTKDGKPREVKQLRQEPITTPHKGSAAEAARLHQWDKGRISERISRRRRDRDDDDDDQPEQATLFG